MNRFQPDSVNRMLAEFSPVPNSESLEDKFEYFYRPYNYNINSTKFMIYADEGYKHPDPYRILDELIEEDKEDFIPDYFKSLGINKSRSCPQREMQLRTVKF